MDALLASPGALPVLLPDGSATTDTSLLGRIASSLGHGALVDAIGASLTG